MKILNPPSTQDVFKKFLLVFCISFIFSLSSFAEKNNGPTCTANITVTPGNTIICAGSSITLTASGGATYIWNDDEVTPSITVSPSTTTAFIVTGTDSNGCIGTDTILITVDNPNVSATSSLSLICPGASTTLNASVEGGVSPFTYAWSPSTWLSCSNCASPVASPQGTINYNIVITDANGCSSSTSVVVNVDNISVSENVTTSPTCPNTAGILTASIKGGVTPFSYQWSPGSGSNSSYNAMANGSTYSIVVTDSNGCSSSATGSISPRDNLIVSLPQSMSICGSASTAIPSTGALVAGTSAFPQVAGGGLFPQVGGGIQPYTYTWSTGATTAYLQLAGLNSGIYSVNVTDSNGCTQSASCNLTVNQPPNITITCSANTIHPGSPDSLIASGASEYYWNNGMTGNKIVVQPYKSTEFYVFGMNANKCPGNWAAVPVVVTNDPWLPSPSYSNSSFDAPVYYLGNVGIGTNSPNYQLEVKGNVSADSSLLIGNLLAGQGININGTNSAITSPTQTINFACDTLSTCGKLKAGSMNISGNKVEMPGIVTDTSTDLMSIDRHGNLTPMSLSSLRALNAPSFPSSNVGPCNSINTLSSGIWVYTPAAYGSANYSVPACDYVGVGMNFPDAPLTVSNGYSPTGVQFTVAQQQTWGLQDVFSIANNGNTIVGTGISQISCGSLNSLIAPIWGEDYLGFNIYNDNLSNFNTYTDGSSNGGAAIIGDAGGGLNFFSIAGTNSTQNQVISESTLLTSSNTVLHIGAQIISAGQYSPRVGIGTTSPTYELDVNGTARANEVRVCLFGTCDFVFDKDYKLMSIKDLEAYLNINHHLPGIQSANEMQSSDGVALGKLNSQLLQKVEELTLYIIQQQKEIDELKKLVQPSNSGK